MGAATMSLFLEVKFKGGLGNQLFQYATARCLSVKKGIPWLLFNTDNYRVDAFGRVFGVMNYRIKGSEIRSGLAKRIFQKGTKYNKIVSLLPLYGGIEEDGLRLHHFPDKLRPLSSLSGYWQSEFYFKDIRTILIEELVPKQIPALPGWMTGAETVAVHIRRTDYLVENRFGSLTVQYYQESIELIRSKVSNPVFVFFSDDLDWCRKNFRDNGFLFCDEQDWQLDYLQLFLMSKCRHQIIANSSFSWWAAWLNANPAKLVVRPEKPFLDDSLMYESYYPVEWINIEN
jgi:Glycosyl transferase family 11